MTFYENGNDYIGKHHDKTDQIDKNVSDKIYSFSIYEDVNDYRIMRFSNLDEKIDFKICNNDMIGFSLDDNKKYKHEILKKKNGGKRINFTFRVLK